MQAAAGNQESACTCMYVYTAVSQRNESERQQSERVCVTLSLCHVTHNVTAMSQSTSAVSSPPCFLFSIMLTGRTIHPHFTHAEQALSCYTVLYADVNLTIHNLSTYPKFLFKTMGYISMKTQLKALMSAKSTKQE